MSKTISILKLSVLLLWCVLAIPFQILILAFAKGKAAYLIPQLWHKGACRIFGLNIEIIGKPVVNRQVFFVGNHLSHFDIFILGSIIRASFVAKDELAKSPVVAFFCRLQQTAFISRSSGQASAVKNNIQEMIDNGKSIILFPEGTSTRGETVLPFKSSLFSLPLTYAEQGLQIQPFTFKLLTVDGKTADTKELRDLYAWDRDNPIELGPHIVNFTRLKGATLQVIFHEPIIVAPGEDRKILASRIQEIVASPLE